MGVLDIPQDWMSVDPRQTVHLDITLQDAQVVHANMILALKHPENVGPIQEAAERLLNYLEEIFEQCGLEEPRNGWRGPGESPPKTGLYLPNQRLHTFSDN